MSRILFAWEFGANNGHLATDLPIAQCLRAGGHDVVFAVRDVGIAAAVLLADKFVFLPVPRRIGVPSSAHPPASYSEILLAAGFDDELTLSGLVQGWLGLFGLLRPEVIVIDHAPIALLAAKIQGIPALLIGNGFAVPPTAAPYPSIRPWEKVPVAKLEESDRLALTTMNAVLSQHEQRPLAQLSHLFAGYRTLLTTFPELDPYGVRADAEYIGALTSEPAITPTQWNPGMQRRVFGYLRPSVPRLEAVLALLAESGSQVICAMPGATPELQQRYKSMGLRIVDSLVPLVSLLPTADLIVTYGTGMMASSLLAGIPLLLLPQVVEQHLGAVLVEKLGAGLSIRPEHNDADIANVLTRVLNDSSFKNAAQQFSIKYKDFNLELAVHRAAQSIAACVGLEQCRLGNR